MRKALILFIILLLAGCSSTAASSSEEEKVFTDVQNISFGEEAPEPSPEPTQTPFPEKIDLSVMSALVCYSTVYDMIVNAENYEGMEVRVRGPLAYRIDAEGAKHYACIVEDAAGCCAQGLEFSLSEETELPPDGTVITLEGIFHSYAEDDTRYLLLEDAVLLNYPE